MSAASLSRPRNRDSVFLLALVAGPGGATQSYRVRNLSREGVCIEEPGKFEKNARITVSIGLLERVPADVMWARGGFAGLRFVSPIDTALARKRAPRSVTPPFGRNQLR